MPEIEILPDARAAAGRAAEEFARLAAEALQIRGRFTVALAGGSTPSHSYELIALMHLDWNNIHLFWGDERCVPPNHPDSNYGNAALVLLSRIDVPPGNVHRIRGEIAAEDAARDYEQELRRCFQGKFPRFDLIMLGLGPDGHTASLFPGTAAIHGRDGWTKAVNHRAGTPPHIDRVTLTLPVINAAANVIFLVCGSDKAEILDRVLKGPSQPDPLPAQAVRPSGGALKWLVDRSAAAHFARGPASREAPPNP